MRRARQAEAALSRLLLAGLLSGLLPGLLLGLTGALVGCDDSARADAGVDASRPDAGRDGGPDAGTDAGPPPRPLCDPEAEPVSAFPAPDAWGPNAGPGGPTRTFTEEELLVNCAYLDGGEGDVTDHHNLLTMYDGYLLMPWAPEWSGGGLSLWDIEDPCSPVQVGYGYSETMRETHSIGFSHEGGRWAVVDMLSALLVPDRGGIQFWDLSDPTAPVAVRDLDLPGFLYPDAYARLSLSVFWQVPYVYVAGADNGVWIVDALDPRNPRLIGQYSFEPTLRAGQVQAVGNLLIVTAAEGPRTVLLDISDPAHPQPIPGGDFLARDEEGNPREAYFTNTGDGYVYYARKEGGGGIMIYDIHDPENPVRSGAFLNEGNGGYVFVMDDLAFVGESSFASIFDISDHSAITEVGRLNLVGDLDTASPIGNVVALSVDDEAEPDRGTAIAPYATDPDTAAPRVTWAWPSDGATDLPWSSRFGVTFSEPIDVRSAFVGSVRFYQSGADPDATRVDGIVSAQERIVTFTPRCPLTPDTEYTLEIPAGGIVDFNGNAIEAAFTATFRTAP